MDKLEIEWNKLVFIIEQTACQLEQANIVRDQLKTRLGKLIKLREAMSNLNSKDLADIP